MSDVIFGFSQIYPDLSGAVKVSLYANRVVIERTVAEENTHEKCVIFLKNVTSVSLQYPDTLHNTRYHLEFSNREGASFWNQGDIKENLEKLVTLLEEML